MTGGIKNPLGAMALYLGNSLYRIHGTNDAKSIGRAASSGCFRMLNGHVVDLAARVDVGTSVQVVHRLPPELEKVVADQVAPPSPPPARQARRAPALAAVLSARLASRNFAPRNVRDPGAGERTASELLGPGSSALSRLAGMTVC